MDGSATLTWYPERGFELDLAADLEDIRLRFASLPVPADGSVELEAGVELNKIDILFKCQAAIDGAPAQLQEARVALREGNLVVEAKLEDVENGLLYPIEIAVACSMPRGVPDAGGPRNQSPDEDDLDWGDETTFEQVAGDVPDAALLAEDDFDDDDFGDDDFGDDGFGDDAAEDEPPAANGVSRLLQALKSTNLDEDDLDDEPTEERMAANRPPASSAPAPGRNAPIDQKLSAVDEALALVRLLVDREELELEDEADPSELGPGVAAILSGRGTDETKAARLSAWLIEQPSVADLYVDDDTLAEILAQW